MTSPSSTRADSRRDRWGRWVRPADADVRGRLLRWTDGTTGAGCPHSGRLRYSAIGTTICEGGTAPLRQWRSLGSPGMRLPGRYDGVARPIVTYGSDPVLHRPCAPVTAFDQALRRLVLDMFASMTAADGVGPAANQIGVDARIFVINCPDATGEDVIGYVITPTLTRPGPVGDEPEHEVGEEGCLSVPGPYADLARA